MRHLLLTTALLLTAALSAAAIRSGEWEFSFDDATGFWQSVKYGGVSVSENPGGTVVPFNWGPGWPGGKIREPGIFRHAAHWMPEWPVFQKETKYQFLGADWKEGERTLALRFRIGDFDAVDLITFGSDLLERKLLLTYAPEKQSETPAIFIHVALNLPVERKGEFFTPGSMSPSAQEPRKFSALPPSQIVESPAWRHVPLLVENHPGRTLVMIPDTRKDISGFLIVAEPGTAWVQGCFRAYGWAYPGETQSVGPVWLRPVDRPLREAAAGGEIWKLFDDIGVKTPASRPEWVRDVVLYSFDNRLTGGFEAARKELLPRFRQLGFTAAWMLPVEESPHRYNPRDYYKISAEMGTEEEYRTLIDEMHRDGMKVLQDIVPHGGTPEFGRERGNKPWHLVFDKNGNTLDYWCFDYGNPEWQAYIEKVARFYIATFNLDGFRIDVPDASHIPNWRRKDFPNLEKTPKNVDPVWWRESLEANGGKLPPIPFERASYTRRGAGLDILKAIRRGMEEAKPTGGALLGEVCPVPYMTEADIVYDMWFCHNLSRDSMPKLDAAAYVKTLKNWFEQTKIADPRGTFRMRYAESHDSTRTRGALGVGAEMGLTAVTFFADGMPMIYHESDTGKGVLLKRLIELRKLLPELRRGEAFYGQVTGGAPTLFDCLRRDGGNLTLGLVNLGPEAIDCEVTVPARFLPAGNLTAWSAKRGAKLEGKLKVKLAPWDWEAISWRPTNGEALYAAPQIIQPEASKPGKVTFARNRWGSWEVFTPNYMLRIRGNGTLHTFEYPDSGNRLIHGMGFLYDTLLSLDQPNLPALRGPKLTETDYGCKIEAAVQLPTGGVAELTYRCYHDRVEVDAALTGEDSSRRAGIYLLTEDAARWQVNTAEGLLDDLYLLRHRYVPPVVNPGRHLRIANTPVVWQARQHPLDPANPEIRIFNSNPGGLSIRLPEPSRQGAEDVMLLDQYHNNLHLHTAFLWKTVENNFPASPLDNRFTLVLKPAAEPLVPAESKGLRRGKLSIRHDSLNWLVDNGHYRLQLARTGGVIRSLKNRGGTELLAGLGPEFSPDGSMRYEAEGDVETAARLSESNGKVRLLFTGALRRWNKSTGLAKPPCRFAVEYVFDESSTFTVNYHLLYDGGLTYAKPTLGLFPQVPAAASIRINDKDRKTNAKALTVEAPERLALLLPDGRELLSLRVTEGGFANIRSDKRDLKFHWAEEKREGVPVGQWKKTALEVSVK